MTRRPGTAPLPANQPPDDPTSDPPDDSTTAADWITAYCSIDTSGAQKLEPYPYQLKLWGDGARQRIVLKSRQMGISRALACEAVYTALATRGSTVLLVSCSLAAARNLLRYARQSIGPAIAEGRLPRPSRVNSTTLEWEKLESRVVSLAASIDAARSFSATAVYLDEAAYLPWAEEIYQSLAPTVSQGGRMTVVSTPHGRGNLFHRLWMDGEQAGSRWSAHRVHWSERPGYTETWAAQERQRHTARSWAEEYDLSFEDSGNSVFAEQYIRALLRPLPSTPGGQGTPPYYAGLDLARYRDYTALAVLDSQGQLLALDRFSQVSWRIQVQRVARVLGLFPGIRAICDATGVGDPIVELLQAESVHDGSRLFHVEPFIYTAESRPILIDDLILAVEGAQLWIPYHPGDVQAARAAPFTPTDTVTPSLSTLFPALPGAIQALVSEMRSMQWQHTEGGRAVPQHPGGGHDDCVQALALAWRALQQGRRRPAPGQTVWVGCRTIPHFTASGWRW